MKIHFVITLICQKRGNGYYSQTPPHNYDIFHHFQEITFTKFRNVTNNHSIILIIYSRVHNYFHCPNIKNKCTSLVIYFSSVFVLLQDVHGIVLEI